MEKILIIEDDSAVRLGLSSTFEEEGFPVVSAESAESGLREIEAAKPDIIVLDVMLPGMSGFEFLKKLRDKDILIPVLMLTARADATDKILGLELGADDYVTKPFNPREILARVKALIRRSRYSGGRDAEGLLKEFRFGDVEVNFDRHEIHKKGQPVQLSHREFRLLEYLIENRGRLITRDRLLEDVWEYDSFLTTRTVDNHILRLRKKIEDEPDSPRFILTIRGYGYKFVAEEAS